MHSEKSILRSYASMQSDQSSSLPLFIVTKFVTTSMMADQNARMHNTLSDLSTRRQSCEQTEMILKKNNIMVPIFVWGCSRLRQVLQCKPYHKKIASKRIKQRKLPSVGTSVQTQQSFCYPQEHWTFRYWWFPAGAQAVQCFQFIDLMSQNVQSGVY